MPDRAAIICGVGFGEAVSNGEQALIVGERSGQIALGTQHVADL